MHTNRNPRNEKAFDDVFGADMAQIEIERNKPQARKPFPYGLVFSILMVVGLGLTAAVIASTL